jgi:hypothetical protein
VKPGRIKIRSLMRKDKEIDDVVDRVALAGPLVLL